MTSRLVLTTVDVIYSVKLCDWSILISVWSQKAPPIILLLVLLILLLLTSYYSTYQVQTNTWCSAEWCQHVRCWVSTKLATKLLTTNYCPGSVFCWCSDWIKQLDQLELLVAKLLPWLREAEFGRRSRLSWTFIFIYSNGQKKSTEWCQTCCLDFSANVGVSPEEGGGVLWVETSFFTHVLCTVVLGSSLFRAEQ